MSDGLDFEMVEKLLSYTELEMPAVQHYDVLKGSNTNTTSAIDMISSNSSPVDINSNLTINKTEETTLPKLPSDLSQNNISSNTSETNDNSNNNFSSSENLRNSNKSEKFSHSKRKSSHSSNDEKLDVPKRSSPDPTRSPSSKRGRRNNHRTISPPSPHHSSSRNQRRSHSPRRHHHRHHHHHSSSRRRSIDRHRRRRSRSPNEKRSHRTRSRSIEKDGNNKQHSASRRSPISSPISNQNSSKHHSDTHRERRAKHRSRSSSSTSSRRRKELYTTEKENKANQGVRSTSTSTRNNTSLFSSTVEKNMSPVPTNTIVNEDLQAIPPNIGDIKVPEVDYFRKEEEIRRNREIEEARRDDLTVLILNLNLNATERDIYEFFAEHAGKVRDIQTIKDQRSGRAKGVAYIEFYQQASVIKALALSGQLLKGQPIRVQASQAEKNRAAKAAKIQQSEFADGPMKLFVGGLVDVLSNISSEEIKQIFSPFGEILSVEIQRDPYTGRSKGFAFVQFKHSSEAKEAMSALSGYVLAGRPLKVGYATEPSKQQQLASDPFTPINLPPHYNMQTLSSNISAVPPPGTYIDPYTQQIIQQQQDLQDSDRLDDDGGGYLSGPGSKLLLMQKLQRGEEVTGLNNMGLPLIQSQQALIGDSSLALAEQKARLLADQAFAMVKPNLQPYPTAQISSNIILHGMFSPSDPSIKEDPEFFSDLIDEAKTECSSYGNIQNVYIKQNLSVLDGTIWVKFSSIEHASKAYSALHGRYFAGNPIRIEFASDAQWAVYCQ